MSAALIAKIQYLLRDDDGHPLAPETKMLLRAAIKKARRDGVRSDLKAGWYGYDDICRRNGVSTATVRAIKVQLLAEAKKQK